MTISYQWLLTYLPEPVDINELCVILTSIGLEVEGTEVMETVKGGLEGLVIGKVMSCEQHTNADKLRVTTVDVGRGDLLQIVCGAPNVAEGQHVLVATIGTTVYPTSGEPFLIKAAKIRGTESQGMICAEDEIGLGVSHDGIMILPNDAPIGQLAKEYFNIKEADIAIHIGLTPNRSDANSHLGVAKDVCAYLNHHKGTSYEVVPPALPQYVAQQPSAIAVSIVAQDACKRYAGVQIEGVVVGPSPEWLQSRLQTIGVRSINNIVDVTNFVLHEYGQPLHAFDAQQLKGGQIVVQHVAEGTPFMALDGKERPVLATDLMICDGAGSVAMGGVFGGLHSGITERTTSIFLESAYFDAMTIRKTSMHHGLRTDAAQHFEKGVDINAVIPALQRAVGLILEMCPGSKPSTLTDVYPQEVEPHEVVVTYAYLHKITGKQYPTAAIKQILKNLGFGIVNEQPELLHLAVPTNKPDVLQPADIAEEILRIDGLDNVVIANNLNIPLLPKRANDRPVREKLANLLCGMGFQEILTNSIVNSKYFEGMEDMVKMINSLSAELDVMRPAMLHSGLEVVQYNYNRKSQDLCLFEFGNTYHKSNDSYVQTPHLAIWCTGNVQTANWGQQAQPASVFYLKGILNNLYQYAGVTKISMDYKEVNGQEETQYLRRKQLLASIVTVPAGLLKQFDIKQPVYYADIHWDVFMQAIANHKIGYKEVPKFPAVQRDLALVLDKQITYKQVVDATEQLKLASLLHYGLFDIFESDKLGVDKKSYALNYTFQLQDRTLTDSEIEAMMQALIAAYQKKLQAQIR